MNYSEAVAYLESLIDYERTPAGAAAARLWNLDRTFHLLQAVGNPHRDLRCLHLAGTKGKGSTAAMAASILTAAGHRTGLYTSPHLVSFRERIRIDGELIPEDDVIALVAEIRPIVEEMGGTEIGPPSFFEAYTLMAFLYFARLQVDLAVLETGLGGRLDATNVVSPMACAITRIGLDHTQELGETIAQIAGEKAGIIKQGVPVISAPQPAEAMEVLEETCLERSYQLLVVGEEPGPTFVVVSADQRRQVIAIRGLDRLYADIECPLLGAYQAENAAVAVGLIDLLSRQGVAVSPDAVRRGIESVRWPGRFQIVSRSPHVVLDGAHDETGAAVLAAALETYFPGRRVLLVLGVGRDKDAGAIASHLCPRADRVLATASSSPRSLDAHELQRLVYRHCRHTAAYTPVSLAIQEALDQARREDVVLITGSLYVVGEAMKALGVAPDG